MEPIVLSLVIPCYNEGANVPLLLERLASLRGQARGVEFIVVDNGSTDATSPLFLEAAATSSYIRTVRVAKNQGYGFGILCGLRAAKGRYIGWTHADLQTDPADAVRALAILEKERYPEKIFLKGLRHGRPLNDRIFTAGMGIFESLLFMRPLWDINAQPNIFPRALFGAWENPPHDFSLDLYALVTAGRLGYSVRRFPVAFTDRLHGSSNWNVNWRAKLKFIGRTIDFSLKLRARKGI
ncbi:MAG: glycosyltransferase [Desulfobulbus sp.]|jgi:glycosyltransferase involved in cell wall biosynthesis|uniref:glycosyltransferase family 2 protein n=1 Tax=Desulfobulbus sp. TaxID=895 RepID=UPI002842D305|nr:glycosyltransferase [Desulfobulbus sp.]MDR2548595.1 glycosyltransferase [Desulfobulbus sp.]